MSRRYYCEEECRLNTENYNSIRVLQSVNLPEKNFYKFSLMHFPQLATNMFRHVKIIS